MAGIPHDHRNDLAGRELSYPTDFRPSTSNSTAATDEWPNRQFTQIFEHKGYRKPATNLSVDFNDHQDASTLNEDDEIPLDRVSP